MLPLALLLVLCTCNNTDGNKLVKYIFAPYKKPYFLLQVMWESKNTVVFKQQKPVTVLISTPQFTLPGSTQLAVWEKQETAYDLFFKSFIYVSYQTCMVFLILLFLPPSLNTHPGSGVHNTTTFSWISFSW